MEKTDKSILPPNDNPLIAQYTKYYSIEDAAQLLGSSPGQLLHLAVQGELIIMAPVLITGEYGCCTSETSLYNDPSKADITYVYSLKERVTLLQNDLNSIEAIGYAYVTSFFDHDRNQPKNNYKYLDQDQDLPQQIVQLPVWNQFEDEQYQSKKTTIKHLFVPKWEVIKFLPLEHPERKKLLCNTYEYFGNKHKANRATPRALVLKAAIYVLSQRGEPFKNCTTWARAIDELGEDYWKSGAPPLTFETIENLLRDAQKLPSQKV